MVTWCTLSFPVANRLLFHQPTDWLLFTMRSFLCRCLVYVLATCHRLVQRFLADCSQGLPCRPTRHSSVPTWRPRPRRSHSGSPDHHQAARTPRGFYTPVPPEGRRTRALGARSRAPVDPSPPPPPAWTRRRSAERTVRRPRSAEMMGNTSTWCGHASGQQAIRRQDGLAQRGVRCSLATFPWTDNNCQRLDKITNTHRRRHISKQLL